MKSRMSRHTCTALIISFIAFPVAAHDYWLQPHQYFLDPDETTPVRLFVGDHFSSESEKTFSAKKTTAFQLISKDLKTDLRPGATDGQKPVCRITPATSGGHLVAMQRDWSHIELKATKFNDYLQHEGLASIAELRRNAGEENTVGRERYRRYLKALIQVGEEHDETYKKKIGHRLEIQPQSNPFSLNTSDTLTVSVLFEGKPLRGVQVAAYNRHGNDTKTQEAKTDGGGHVRFRLNQSGLWLIRLVHMRRCNDVADIDWESFWAAYSFQIK